METVNPDTRTALLHAALACFAERGFDGTSMRTIAQRAGRPLSLLSHYFGNKSGLYVETFTYVVHDLKRLPSGTGGGASQPRDKAEAIRMLREHVHFIVTDTCMDPGVADTLRENAMKLWLQEVRAPRVNLHALIRQHLAPTSDTMKHCIQMLRPDLAEAEVIFLGVSIIGSAVTHGLMAGLNQVLWGFPAMPENRFRAAELLVEFCLAGLKGAGTQGGEA